MKKDKEPDQLASIAISREEIASRHRISGTKRTVAQPAANSKVLWAITVFSLLLVVALMVQLQQVKSQSEKQLKALTILQEKLTSTDEQANLSVDAIRILVKEQEHEIRKLWDVSNKRNKSNINKNSNRLDEQNKLLTKQSGKMDLIEKDLQKQSDQLGKKLKAAQGANEKSIASLTSRLDSLHKQVGSLPKDLSKTLKDHGKGIDAMDATRLQLLKRIKALEAQVKSLNSAKATGA